jgi:hypothetical protein
MGIKIHRLDFSQLRTISTGAAMVLVSTVDQWKERVRRKLRANFDEWHEDIKKALCQMGYCEALKISPPSIDLQAGSTSFIRFLKGSVMEGKSSSKAVKLRKQLENVAGASIERQPLFEGISEAITNVCQHAYAGVTDDSRKYWWVSGSFDQKTRELCVTFYDRGIGIPRSILKNKLLEILWAAMGKWTDSKRIEAAMKLGRSSTKRTERGKGLNDFIAFAKAHERGKLQIRSLRGLYEQQYQNTDGVAKVPITRRSDYKNSVGGTLIEWSVILAQ